MGNIGVSELVVILLILMLVFGASRLPALGESLGKTIRSFKRGVAENDAIEVQHVNKDVDKTNAADTKRVAAASSSRSDDSVSDAEIVEETKRR